MLDLLEFTPAFQQWNATSGTADQESWGNYQAYIMRVDLALCMIDVLWPDFIVRENLILREANIPQDWEKFVSEARSANWTSSDIEYVVNHIHVSDLFLNDPDRDRVDLKVYQYIANVIAEMWKCRLHILYPDRQFSVTVNDYEIAPEVSAYSLK
jgi:hypothetical protein